MEEDRMELRIDVGPEPDAAAGELDKATEELRQELLEFDAEGVGRQSAESPPSGTGAVKGAPPGTLVVAATQERLSAVVRTLVGWLGRRTGRSVKLEIGGDLIKVSDSSSEDQRRLIAAFLARHAALPGDSDRAVWIAIRRGRA